MILEQEELQQLFSAILAEKGENYQKTKNIFARKAKVGEEIITNTSDGEETRNIAEADEYIITNQTEAQEEYLLSAENFKKKYDLINENEAGIKEYKSKSKISAVELTDELLEKLDLPHTFHFIAAWGDEMIAKVGDYIVQPFDAKEMYRIARKEFFETYSRFE